MAPALLILIALVGTIYGGNSTMEVEGRVAEYLREDAASLITRAIAGTTNRVAGSRGPTILAIMMMLIGASAVFSQVLAAMNKVWRVHPKPGRGLLGVLRDRFWPFTMVFLISALLFVSLLVSTVTQVYSTYVNRVLPEVAFAWHYLDLAFSFAIVTVLFALIYKFLPDARVVWSDVWVGALATAIFFSGGKYLSSVYLSTTAIESVYGAAGIPAGHPDLGILLHVDPVARR